MRKPSNSQYALAVIETLVIAFPGLLDGETDVNGADLVNEFSAAIQNNADLVSSLKQLTCEHGDTDDAQCLDCGADLTETLAAQAYDRAKDRAKYGD